MGHPPKPVQSLPYSYRAYHACLVTIEQFLPLHDDLIIFRADRRHYGGACIAIEGATAVAEGPSSAQSATHLYHQAHSVAAKVIESRRSSRHDEPPNGTNVAKRLRK